MREVTDLDFAYFLGLCVARGEILREKLSIRFRYKTRNILSPPKINADLARKSREYVIDTTTLKNKLERFLSVAIEIVKTENEFILNMPMIVESFSYKLITSILKSRNFSFKKASIPNAILSSSKDVKIHFLMGIADACSCPTYADRDQAKRCRICLDIAFENWILPIQICEMLQKDLSIKVHCILWGHPNLRTPRRPNSKAWSKEHRIRIFAEEFAKVGFRFEFKKDILDSFLDHNKTLKKPNLKFCWVEKKGRSKIKPEHPGESDHRIPKEIRGYHFNSFREICSRMGCCQKEKWQ